MYFYRLRTRRLIQIVIGVNTNIPFNLVLEASIMVFFDRLHLNASKTFNNHIIVRVQWLGGALFKSYKFQKTYLLNVLVAAGQLWAG